MSSIFWLTAPRLAIASFSFVNIFGVVNIPNVVRVACIFSGLKTNRVDFGVSVKTSSIEASWNPRSTSATRVATAVRHGYPIGRRC